MSRLAALVLWIAFVPALWIACSAQAAPAYGAEGRLLFPKDYRSWIYLSSGLGMSYSPMAAGEVAFDNVFVDREAYNSFQQTGTWPDGTVLVLEVRGAEQRGSINKTGHFQGAVMHREVHVKDTARFKGGWAFFPSATDAPATVIPTSADCYSCHQAHGAVDTTFVQFYPTLLPVAQAKKTLSPEYVAEQTSPKL